MSVLVQDSFTDADGTLITNHSPEIGGVWTAGSTKPTINSNRCKSGAAGANSCGSSTAHPGGNVYAQAKVYGLGSVTIGIYNGPSYGNNTYIIIGTGSLSLGSNGGSSVINPFTYTPGATYRVEIIGTTAYAYENGVEVASLAGASAGAANPGFYLEFAGINAAIDDYEAGLSTPIAPTLLTAMCSTGIGESTLPDAPGTSFSADVYSGLAPLTVQFTDRSSGSPTSWLWEDATGTFSTSQNPSRIFDVGIHTVRLTATNAQGSNSYQATIIATTTPVVTLPEDGTIIPVGDLPGDTLESVLGKIGYFAVDTANNAIKIYGNTGTVLKTFGGIGTAVGKFFMPTTCSVINGKQLLDRVVIDEE